MISEVHQKRPLKDYIGIPRLYLMVAALAALVAVSGPAVAEQNDWIIDNRFGSGVELSITHIQPEDTVPIGEVFWISTVAWTTSLGVDSITLNPLILDGDCTIISETINNATSPTDASGDSDALILMTGPSCVWHRHVQANDAVIGTVAQVHVVGHVSAFDIMELGQTADDGAVGFWVPLIIIGGLFMYFGNRAATKHQIWLWAVIFTFLALLTIAIPDIPVEAAMPARFWAIGTGFVVLMITTFAAIINARADLKE